MNWKYFSLEQINQDAGEGVNIWDEPEGYTSRGLLALKASAASRRQGQDAFARFHKALLAERHENGRKLVSMDVIDDVARAVGLDLDRLHHEMDDPTVLEVVAREHTEAVERYGAFGCPTLVFNATSAAYLKMRPPPPDDEAVEFFESFHKLVADRAYISEVKRPVKRG